jgi:ABC-type glycerol-3-phosphate transport system substrate-binding protein
MQYFDFAMYYNKDLFAESGIKNPPTTWEEMEADAIACTKLDSAGQVEHYGIDIPLLSSPPIWYAFIWQAGGDIVSADNSKALINEPEAVSAGKLLERLFVEDKVTPVGITGADSDTLFQSGKSCMHITGPWMIAGFDKAGLNYGIVPLPKGKVEANIADGPGLAINASSKEADAAWRFLSYWNSTESLKYFALNAPAPPASKALMNDPDIQANEKLSAFAAGLPYSKTLFPNAPNRTDIDDAVSQAIQQIAYGKLSAQEAFDKAAETINTALQNK